MARLFVAASLEERFWDKVSPEPTTGCFLWMGAIDKDGYGKILESNDGRLARAHRVAFQLAAGRPPEMELDHVCRNRACVNPSHLREVTKRQNAANGMWALTTHCPAGHPYSVANTYRDRNGRRYCRACNLVAVRKYKAHSRKVSL